jgi:hypothetical protein
MSGKPFVFVLGYDGQPLMPCTGKRARLLLERGRARVKRIKPFVIQLKDRSVNDCLLQPLEVKIDPGSKTTGICLSRTEQGVSKRSKEQLFGRTEQNKVVVFDRGKHHVGDFVKVMILNSPGLR